MLFILNRVLRLRLSLLIEDLRLRNLIRGRCLLNLWQLFFMIDFTLNLRGCSVRYLLHLLRSRCWDVMMLRGKIHLLDWGVFRVDLLIRLLRLLLDLRH